MEPGKAKILAVDDNIENRVLISALLKREHKVMLATGGQQALDIAKAKRPDLILLDIMMPEMDGYEVCERLKADPQLAEIPVIFLTAKSQIEDEQRGFEVGAVDYILKPISPPILSSRVNTHLKLAQAKEVLARQNEILEEKVKQRTRELEQLQDATMSAMASLAETRDNETGNHIRRTQHYIKALAEQLVAMGHYQDILTPAVIELYYKSAPLHDIGKVGIPDQVLLKPGKLTDEEFTTMKTHAAIGQTVIEIVEDSLDFESDFLKVGKEIASGHHEKWDGSGYPNGLSGEAIPLSARLMAVADVYDALISHRVYKPGFSHEKAVSIITEGAGQHFDPLIVEVFLSIESRFAQIAREFSDKHSSDET